MLIEIPQLKLQIEASPGANLLSLLSAQQVPIARSCGGDGVCGTCKIFIDGDSLPEKNSTELRLEKHQSRALSQGERFACQITIPPLESSKKWVIRSNYW